MPGSQQVGAKYDAIGGCVRVCGVSRWLIKGKSASAREGESIWCSSTFNVKATRLEVFAYRVAAESTVALASAFLRGLRCAVAASSPSRNSGPIRTSSTVEKAIPCINLCRLTSVSDEGACTLEFAFSTYYP